MREVLVGVYFNQVRLSWKVKGGEVLISLLYTHKFHNLPKLLRKGLFSLSWQQSEDFL